MIFNAGVSRSEEEIWTPVDIELQSLKRFDECLQKEEILQKLVGSQAKTITRLEKSLSIAEKERDLEERDHELSKKIIEIKDKEIASINDSFNRLKDVTDRAIKLAGQGKSVFQDILEWVIRFALFAAGVLLAK